MKSIEGLRIKEVVKHEMEGGYTVVHGWTESFGRDKQRPYLHHLSRGWEWDTRYADERGGGHGGCPSCVMTLIHLISTEPESIPTPVQERSTPWLYIAAAAIGLYVLIKR